MHRLALVVLYLVGAVAALAPFALAHDVAGAPAQGTLRAWHGDTWTTPVDAGVGIDTGIAGIVPVQARAEHVAGLLGQRVATDGRTLRLAGRATPAARTAAATGGKSVAVVLFNFADDTSQPWTQQAVRDVFFDTPGSVRSYYLDASYGQLSLTGQVLGWVTIDAAKTGCDYTAWASQARSKLTAAGQSLTGYQYVVYAFPRAPDCGWAGLAYLPGTSSWLNGSMTLRTAAHELGHNFGVHHASTLSCSTGSLAGTCTASEYGDPFTVMGGAAKRHHNNWHRAQLGWLSDVSTVSASGIYSLTPAELSTGSPRVLRVPRGDGTYLTLEYRQPSGSFDDFASSDPVVNGVSVRIAPETNSIVQSKLVDATPGSAGGFGDAALPAGATLTDPLTGTAITVISISPASAGVSVTLGSSGGDVAPPTTPGSFTAAPQSMTTVALAWTASTDNRGVTGYRISRGGTVVTTTTSLSFTDTGRTPGTTYQYEVRAVDAAGNLSSPATASATTPADSLAPSAPGQLVATRTWASRVRLGWGVASDNVGVVGYRVYRGTTQVAQVTTLSFQDRPGRGTFTYTVRAVDAVGNLGPASNALTVRL